MNPSPAATLRKTVWSLCFGLSRFSIAHPRLVLALTALITAVALAGLSRLKLRTDGHALVSETAPQVAFDHSIRKRFGIEDNIVVLIRATNSEGIFNPATLQLVRDLTSDLTNTTGPSHILSLATEPSFRIRPGTLIHETLLEVPTQSKAQLQQLREDLRRMELYTGTLVATDGFSTVILAGIPEGAERTAFYERVVSTVRRKPARGHEILVTGAPVAEALLGLHILEDLGVPKRLMGVGTHETAVGEETKNGWHGVRAMLARKIGLVPIAVTVMMLVFFVGFRNLVAMLVPLPGVAVTLVFVFGLMGWCGIPIYLTIAVMPVLLTALCITNDIYLLGRYLTLLQSKSTAGHVELVTEAFDRMVLPVAITSITSALGFLSFAFSPLAPVRAFGVVCAVGAVFGLLYSLTVIPSILISVQPRRFCPYWVRVGRGNGANRAIARTFEHLAAFAMQKRLAILAGVLVVIAVLPFGLRRLAVQDSWTNAFERGSQFHHATQLINSQYCGMHLLFVSLDAPKMLSGEIAPSAVTGISVALPTGEIVDPAEIAGSIVEFSGADTTGNNVTWHSRIEMAFKNETQIMARLAPSTESGRPWEILAPRKEVHFQAPLRNQLRPEVVRHCAEVADFIRQRPQYAVGGVLGPADYLSTTRFMARPEDPNARILAEAAGENKLMWDFYALARGPQRLRQIIDSNYWQSLTTVFLKDANFADTAHLMADLRKYEQERMKPAGIKLGFAGDVALSQSLISGIVSTQLLSLVWSLAGISVTALVLGGSLRWAVYCLVPCVLAVVIKFAVMGWTGIPIGVATSMFAAMTLGIGVSCAIHLLEAFSFARARFISASEAVKEAMRLTGSPALMNTVGLSLGFSVLMLSQVPANARLGVLLVLGLANCFLVSILLLPVLLSQWPLRPHYVAPEEASAPASASKS